MQGVNQYADIGFDLNPVISLSGVRKEFRGSDSTILAVAETDLDIMPSEIVSFVGPSGCGKTTLLNIVAGLLRPTAGTVYFNGVPLLRPTSEIGLVFQRPVLLPWRRIIDNVLLPVEVMRLRPREAYIRRADELLDMVGLAHFKRAYPRQLSGGMQQRASIARALISDSKVLLMDEPFAALDAITRDELNLEILRIWNITKKTILFVTHNVAEAVLLSNRIIVMTAHPGRVRAIVDVKLSGPRNARSIEDPKFSHLVTKIRGLLGGLQIEPS